MRTKNGFVFFFNFPIEIDPISRYAPKSHKISANLNTDCWKTIAPHLIEHKSSREL